MASTTHNLPAQYRAKAQDARERAKATTDDTARQKLLNDADLWDRMAAYEEAHPTAVVPRYYPPPD